MDVTHANAVGSGSTSTADAVVAHVVGGEGNHGSRASMGGSSHSVKAGPAPNSRRAGLRTIRTMASPSVTHANAPGMSARLFFNRVQQLAQFGDCLSPTTFHAG